MLQTARLPACCAVPAAVARVTGVSMHRCVLFETWLPFQGATVHRLSVVETDEGRARVLLPSPFPGFIANVPPRSISGVSEILADISEPNPHIAFMTRAGCTIQLVPTKASDPDHLGSVSTRWSDKHASPLCCLETVCHHLAALRAR